MQGPRNAPYWFFRYWFDESLADGTVKTSPETPHHRAKAPDRTRSAGESGIRADRFLVELNRGAVAMRGCGAGEQNRRNWARSCSEKLAEMWQTRLRERKVGGQALITASTKAKYVNHLNKPHPPRWQDTRLADFRAKGRLGLASYRVPILAT